METLTGWLMGLLGPAAKRVLISLGFGLLSFTGVGGALGFLLTVARTAWASQSGTVLQLLGLAGAHYALALIAGALIARVAYRQTKFFSLL